MARSRTLGEARWSPDGDPPGLARGLRRAGRPRGRRRPTAVGPAVTLTAEVPVTGARRLRRRRLLLGRTTTRWSTPPPTAASLAVAGGRRCRCGSSSRDGRAAAPAASPDGDRVAFVLERDDACDIAVVAARRRAAGPRRSRTPTSPGTRRGRPTAARSRGTSGTSRTCRGTGRASWPSRSTMPTRSPTLVAGGDDVAVGQPRFAPDGRRARVRLRARRLDERVGRRAPTARAARACSPKRTSTPSRRGARASGRSRGRPTAPRSRSTATRTASAASSSSPLDGWTRRDRRVAKGWHTGLDWGARGIVVHPLGRAHPAAAHRARSRRPAHATRASRAARRPSSTRSTCPSPTPVTWPRRRRRDRARAAVAAARRRRSAPAPPAAARRRARRTDRPGAPSTGSPGSATSSSAGLGGAAAPTTGVRPATAATTGRRSTTRGATSTSPTPSPGSAPPAHDGLGRPGARRGDGRQRRRVHRAARRRARTGRRARRR